MCSIRNCERRRRTKWKRPSHANVQLYVLDAPSTEWREADSLLSSDPELLTQTDSTFPKGTPTNEDSGDRRRSHNCQIPKERTQRSRLRYRLGSRRSRRPASGAGSRFRPGHSRCDASDAGWLARACAPARDRTKGTRADAYGARCGARACAWIRVGSRRLPGKAVRLLRTPGSSAFAVTPIDPAPAGDSANGRHGNRPAASPRDPARPEAGPHIKRVPIADAAGATCRRSAITHADRRVGLGYEF